MARTLGTVLRERRKSLGMTQWTVASALNVTRAAVGQWESGTHEPSTENLIAVCKFLNLDIEATVRGEYFENIKKDVNKLLYEARTTGKRVVIDKLIDDMQQVIDDSIDSRNNKIGLYIPKIAPDQYYFYLTEKPILMGPRPLKLKNEVEAYCLRISNDYLYPKFVRGELVYINPREFPKKGDYVIVKTDRDEDGLKDSQTSDNDYVSICVAGKYFSDDSTNLTLEIFNPHVLLKIQLTDHHRIERVCDPSELVGF